MHCTPCNNVSIVYFELVIASWEYQIQFFKIKNAANSILNINCQIHKKLTKINECSHTNLKLAAETTIGQIYDYEYLWVRPKMLQKNLRNSNFLIPHFTQEKKFVTAIFLGFWVRSPKTFLVFHCTCKFMNESFRQLWQKNWFLLD